MYAASVESLENGRVLRHRLLREGTALCYCDVLALWAAQADFRSFFIELLSEVPYSAYRWETPAVSHESIHRQFEFVLLDSPGLSRDAEPETFARHFSSNKSNAEVVVFQNLGKDATLVVPCPLSQAATYAHLAVFMRTAPDSQKHALWRTVGETVKQDITQQPLWLSTAGAGVAWLHVRLDSRPKYYGFQACKKLDEPS